MLFLLNFQIPIASQRPLMYQHHLFHQQFAQRKTAMVRAALIKYIKNATNIQFVMPTYRLPT